MDVGAVLGTFAPWVLGIIALAAFIGIVLAVTRMRGANIAFGVAGGVAVVAALAVVVPMLVLSLFATAI